MLIEANPSTKRLLIIGIWLEKEKEKDSTKTCMGWLKRCKGHCTCLENNYHATMPMGRFAPMCVLPYTAALDMDILHESLATQHC